MDELHAITIPGHKRWLLITFDDKEFFLNENQYNLIKLTIKNEIKFADLGEIIIAVADIRRIEENNVKDKIKYEFE